MATVIRTREIARDVIWRLLLANAVAAILTAAAIELSEPARGVPVLLRLLGSIGSTIVATLVVAALVIRRWLRTLRVVLKWLDDDRSPSAKERADTVALPWRGARELFWYWLGASASVGALFLVTDGITRTAPAAMAAALLGGVTATTLSFFLGERALRPAIVLALAGEPPEESRTLGVRRRILSAWILGSGVPLAWIALVPIFRHPDSDVPFAFLTTLLAATGLAAGAAISLLTGHSVGGPVEQVRQGVEAVARGELDISLTVDDSGELGFLEAGFNNMVRAVAERQRLRDLFGRHVGEEVAQRALDRGVELGGELREVSVLFVDLIGSTALALEREPAEIVAMLNRFFSAVVGSTTAEGGWVNKFEGDAALCIFGTPEPQPDHAACALRAARTLRQSLEGIDAGIGVSAGYVVAGNVGTEARYEYTVIGHPVNEAARLVEQAKERHGRVLASSAVVERSGAEAAAWRSAGEIRLRGIADAVNVYEPLDAGPVGADSF